MRRPELGVFLPVARNGFIYSRNATPYAPTFEDNLAITLRAEEMGLSYVFSMAKWRGFGGAIQMWDASLDSFSLMLALAARTKRVGLIATVNPLLTHPTPMAKMAATFDDVSNGRAALNIITGAALSEYSQMGIVPDGYDQDRYGYAGEWIEVVKRLWSEPRVTHRGRYFQLDDCICDPKPLQRPRLVCAAASDEGLRFTCREADWCFVSARDIEGARERAERARRIAAEEGREIKVAMPVTLIIGDDDRDAAARVEHLIDGVDIEAMRNAGTVFSSQTRAHAQSRGAERLGDIRKIFMGLLIAAGPEGAARQLSTLAEIGIDNVVLIFPDYMEGLGRLAGVLSILEGAGAAKRAPDRMRSEG